MIHCYIVLQRYNRSCGDR